MGNPFIKHVFPEQYEVDITHDKNLAGELEEPKVSLEDKLPRAMLQKLDEFKMSNWYGLSEEQLREKIKPTKTVNQLRLQFWREFDRASRSHGKMEMSAVYGGVSTHASFNYLMRFEKNLAWVLTPPSNYQVLLEDALEVSTHRLREILELPIIDRDDKINVPLIKVMVDIYKYMDAKVNGGVTQKIQTTSLNINVDKTGKEIEKPVDIDARLKELEKEIKQREKIVGEIEYVEADEKGNDKDSGSGD